MERNCLLYRGYFYDHETGLYYLQSRYYDPEVGRFINADSMVSTQQGILCANMLAYCENDPVMRCDPSGHVPIRMYSVMMTDGGGGSNPVSNTTVSSTTNTTASNTRDVTQEVDHALQEYVKLGNSLSQLVLPAPGPVLREAAKYYIFFILVNHKAPWDIKRKAPWEKTIGTPFPGEGTIIKYHDLFLTPEELGNYTYGVLGREFGIPISMLHGGSYFAAHCPIWGDKLYDELYHDWQFINLGYYRGYR